LRISQTQKKFIGIETLDEQRLREMSNTLADKAECSMSPEGKASYSIGAPASA